MGESSLSLFIQETLKLLSDTPRHRQKLASVFGVLGKCWSRLNFFVLESTCIILVSYDNYVFLFAEALQATADCVEEFGEEIANMAAEIFTAL